jgi:hypothetical protein
MAHIEQRDFCMSVLALHPKYFEGVKVLDVGSLDINGNNRYLFTNCDYVGIDVGNGNNVDIVSKGHEFTSEVKFDTIISTECFEHDMFYEKTLNNIVHNLLSENGLFLFTCATIGRAEHGTSRQNSGCSPLTSAQEEWKDYYKNLTIEDIRAAIDVDNIFSSYHFAINENSHDLYFWGIKK